MLYHYILHTRKGVEGMKGKPYILFYSHGGGGRVREAMVNLFRYVGTLVGEPLGCPGAPSRDILNKCRDLGKILAEKGKIS